MLTFNFSISFDVVTAESAEDGEAAESGWLVEDDTTTLREALSDIEYRGGVCSLTCYPGSLTVYHYPEQDSRTGDETSEASHFRGDVRVIARLARIVARQYRIRL
jgi:hypothetical protein